MFINDIHLFAYIFIAFLGVFAGFFSGWCNTRLPEHKKVFTKDIFLEYKTSLKPNYILMIASAVIYVILLYSLGWHKQIIMNLPLISFMILTPMLLSAFCIDLKLTIIPNRLCLTIFEVALVFAFIYGIINFNIAKDCIFGMFAGAGIFLAISLIGRLIAGKEAMGLGDVKLMGALGLFLGLTNIIMITALSFLIGAIISIIIMIIKRRTDQYIPFGPFIVIATFIAMILPQQMLFNILVKIFTLGMM